MVHQLRCSQADHIGNIKYVQNYYQDLHYFHIGFQEKCRPNIWGKGRKSVIFLRQISAHDAPEKA